LSWEYEERVNHRGTETLRKRQGKNGEEKFFEFKAGDNFQGVVIGHAGQYGQA
jgi:hypothetical protein